MTVSNTDQGPVSSSGFPPFMRRAELAKILHMKPKTLAEWHSRGLGPSAIKAGPRLVLYSAASVEEFLAKGRRNSTAEAA